MRYSIEPRDRIYVKDEHDENVELTTHKKRYISPEERQQIINELILILKIYISLKEKFNY